MKRKKESRRRGRRIARGIFLGTAAVFVLAAAAGAFFLSRAVDPAADERLFRTAGKETGCTLFYSAAGGEKVPGLPGYAAREWTEERLCGEKRVYTPAEEIPENLKNAFIAIEDRRFYSHDGVDILRTGKAALNSIFHFAPRFGGSTVTQQLVKNLSGEREQTAARKIKEMARAVGYERRHGKTEILTAYLNIVPLGHGYVGVGAGSAAYFGKRPGELSLAECASLAAVTRSPANLDPRSHPKENRARRELVLAKMLEYGMIGEEEYRAAVAEEVTVVTGKEQERAGSWYAETVRRDVYADLLAAGYTETEARRLLDGGELCIYTCMDPVIQRAAEEVFADPALPYDKQMRAAMTVADPGTGKLLAVVGSRGKKTSTNAWNYATDARRAPGSALKPIALYAPAVEEGLIDEGTVFDDVPTAFPNGRAWPRNASGGYDGMIPARDALAFSKNTVAVRLYEQLGAERIYDHLERNHRLSSLRREKDGHTDLAPAPLALGQLTDGVTLRELTAAYLPLAGGGVMHKCRSYLLVTDRDGVPILQNADDPSRVYSPATAAQVTHMLTRVVEEGSAASLTLSQTVDTAGKTGTSGESRDRWFIGYTPSLLAGVWCGFDSGNKAVTGKPHLELFDRVMQKVSAARTDYAEEEEHFSYPGLVPCRVCRDSGLLCTDACLSDPRGDRTVTVLLPRGRLPRTACDRHISVWHDDLCGGVYPGEDCPGEGFSRVSLLRAPDRDFPVDVFVRDAEYLYRAPQGTLCTDPYRSYFDTDGQARRSCGRSSATLPPYNALSPRYYAEEETEDDGERLPFFAKKGSKETFERKKGKGGKSKKRGRTRRRETRPTGCPGTGKQ